MHKLFTSTIVAFSAVVASLAQSFTPTVIATGGFYSEDAEGYTLSFTFGEGSIKTFVTNSVFFCEGFQQGAVEDIPLPPDNDVNVYPNPLIHTSKLKIFLPVLGETNSYMVSIFSMNGQILFIQKFMDILSFEELEVDLAKYGKGMYFVKIQSFNGQYLKTFKVEKL